MTRIHKGFYLGSWITGGGIIILMLVVSWMAEINGSTDLSNVLYLYALVPYVCLGLIWLFLLYNAWAAIQDDQSSVTPVKAVGFMLVPFYRYYWIFHIFWKYPREFNAYASRHYPAVAAIPDGFFMAFSILWIVTGVLQGAVKGTGLQILLLGAYIVVGAIVFNILCSGLIRLADARQGSLREEAAPLVPH